MADLPSGPPVKVNDVEVSQDAPATESLLNKIGVDLNYLIDNIDNYENVKLKRQEFTVNGTFNVPANTNRVLVIGCGGGGGGAGGFGVNTASGSDGGDGAPIGVFTAAVTPGGSETITIGTAGSGGAAGSGAQGSPGGNGGDTSFGSQVTFLGARGGAPGQSFGIGGPVLPTGMPVAQGNQWITNRYPSRTLDHRPVAGSAAGGSGGFNFTNNGAGRQDGFKGQTSIFASGGNGGVRDGISKSGGGGGGASLEAGGGGGDGGVNNATVGGIGAGGGGGCSSSPNGGTGANGGSGYLVVVWVES